MYVDALSTVLTITCFYGGDVGCEIGVGPTVADVCPSSRGVEGQVPACVHQCGELCSCTVAGCVQQL